MPERYEAEFGRNMAEFLIDRLRRAATSAGFDEVLRLPEPAVTEFRKGEQVMTLAVEDAGHHRCRLSLEAKGTDVQPIVGEAARLALLEVAEQILEQMPWVDRAALEKDLDRALQDGLAKTPPAA